MNSLAVPLREIASKAARMVEYKSVASQESGSTLKR
jgi:hypothetical protein